MSKVEELKKLTDNLPPIPKLRDLVLAEYDNIVEYDVGDGYSIGLGVLSKPEIAVQDLLLSKGASFPPHYHATEIEYGIIYQGSMEVTINDVTTIYGPGDCIRFNSGEVHSGVALEERTRLLAIAIPRINGYPKV